MQIIQTKKQNNAFLLFAFAATVATFYLSNVNEHVRWFFENGSMKILHTGERL